MLTVITLLGKLCHDNQTKDWLSMLPSAALVIRQTVQTRSGYSPFKLLHGRSMPGSPLWRSLIFFQYRPYFDALKAIANEIAHSRHPSESEVCDHTSGLPQLVFFKTFTKRSWDTPRYVGPYKVVRRTHNAVRIENNNTWYHWTHLNPYYDFLKDVVCDPIEGGGGGHTKYTRQRERNNRL